MVRHACVMCHCHVIVELWRQLFRHPEVFSWAFSQHFLPPIWHSARPPPPFSAFQYRVSVNAIRNHLSLAGSCHSRTAVILQARSGTWEALFRPCPVWLAGPTSCLPKVCLALWLSLPHQVKKNRQEADIRATMYARTVAQEPKNLWSTPEHRGPSWHRSGSGS